MPAGQAFAFQGFVVDRCAAAGAALLWLLPLGLVAFSGAPGGLQGFIGSALLQCGGAHIGLQMQSPPWWWAGVLVVRGCIPALRSRM